jgi:hypothetical protein
MMRLPRGAAASLPCAFCLAAAAARADATHPTLTQLPTAEP